MRWHDERLLDRDAVVREFCRLTGIKISKSSLSRYTTRGYRGIKLPVARRLGSRTLFRAEDVREFVLALNPHMAAEISDV